jgi:sigma-E factor negative regulatory protein RseC
MIDETGTVVEIRGDLALVRTERGSACEGCGSAGFCHLSEENDECTVEAENLCHAQTGQKVRVAVPTASFLKGTFFLYLFPLIGLFAGMTAGVFFSKLYFKGSEELFAALGSLLGLFLFFLLQRLINKRFEQDRRYLPVVVEVL